MKEYRVTFVKYYNYYVEAENEDEAIEIAEEKFETDKRRPIADITYDEVECENYE